MWILRSGFCGGSLRTSVLIVLNSNVICYTMNYLFYLGTIIKLDINGFPKYMIISKLIGDMLNTIVPVVPVVKTPEKKVFWLKAFIFMKMVEVISTVFYMFEMIHLDIIKKICNSLIDERFSEIHLNSIQHARIEELFDDITYVVKFVIYTYMVLWILVFGVYFPFIVYSYLKEIKRKNSTNAHSSPVDRNLVVPEQSKDVIYIPQPVLPEQSDVIFIPQPPYNPYVNTVPIAANAV